MIEGTVVRGHGVASGASGDPRFPQGTLSLQFPIFASLGIDLADFHPGTINLDIAPAQIEIVTPRLTLADVRWHPNCPPETFSFFDCTISGAEIPSTRALIYRPHPETKPEHFQSPTVLEILAPRIETLSYDMRLQLEADSSQIRFRSDQNSSG